MLPFSNPTKEKTLEDYPLGGSRRGKCKLWLEIVPKKGQRAMKQTEAARKPTADTYSARAAFVDRSDGKTYLLTLAQQYPMITVSRVTDFKNANLPDSNSATVHQGDALYDTLLALINQAHS